MDNLIMICLMDMVYIIWIIKQYTKENGKMISVKE